MAMEKRWLEMFDRLEGVEKAVRELTREVHASSGKATKAKVAPPVTKTQLMKIKGVGESTADEILKLIND